MLDDANKNTVLSSLTITDLGTMTMSYRPPVSGAVHLVFTAQGIVHSPGSVIIAPGPAVMGYYTTTYQQQNVTTTICDHDNDKYRFGFNGQEKVNEWAGLGNHNTALDWEYGTREGKRLNRDTWNPNPSISPYIVFDDNPIWKNDPLGNLPPSTDVVAQENGTYKVVGGQADGDRNIYIDNSKGQRTGQVLGQSLTEYSFLRDEGKAVKGAIINPRDQSGNNFLNNTIMGRDLSLVEYMPNARGGHIYDFKTLGLKQRDPALTASQYMYRGMPFGDPKNKIFSSARDFGNVAAGYEAGVHGLPWGLARKGFDALETSQHHWTWTTEGQPTQRAERFGYNIGIKLFNKTRVKIQMLNNLRPVPLGPK